MLQVYSRSSGISPIEKLNTLILDEEKKIMRRNSAKIKKEGER